MQNKKFIPLLLVLSLSTVARAQSGADIFKSLAKQTLNSVVATNMPALTALPPKPLGLTNLPRVSLPELLIEPAVREKMGGSELTSTTRQKLIDILIQSERFLVNTNANSPYRFVATVVDFENYEIEVKTKSAATALANQFLKVNLGGNQAKINWDKDESLVYVKCGVSLNFQDTRTGDLLFAGQGAFEQKAALSVIRTELMGLEYGKGTINNGNVQAPKKIGEFEIKTKLFEYAAQQALKDMLPKLDAYLLGLQPTLTASATSAVAVTPATNASTALKTVEPAQSPAPTTSTAVPKPKFCTNCGGRIAPEDKFCANCGTPTKR